MSRDEPQIRVRLEPGLKEMLMAAAKANNRTFTAEVETRLLNSFKQETTYHTPSIAPAMQGMEQKTLYEIKIRLDALSKHLGLKHI